MIDVGLLGSIAIMVIVVSVFVKPWPNGAAPAILDIGSGPLLVGVIGGRLASMAFDDPASMTNIRDVMIIRGGVEFWVGVAAGSVYLAVRGRNRVQALELLAAIAVPAVLAWSVYEATCVIRDGCPGPVSSIGLRPPGLVQQMFPVGLVVAAAGVAAALMLPRRSMARHFTGGGGSGRSWAGGNDQVGCVDLAPPCRRSPDSTTSHLDRGRGARMVRPDRVDGTESQTRRGGRGVSSALLPAAAVAAGFVSASSPCVLPVIPGYLAAVSATRADDDCVERRVIGAVGFVVGFTIVFTVLGATASAVGGFLFDRLDLALRLAGIALVVFGLHTLGVVYWSRLGRERRPIALHSVGTGPKRAVALGAVFAIGWTPCIGPILATILTKAAVDASLVEGMWLLLLYSIGLGVPFVAVAIWFDRSRRVRLWLALRARMLQGFAGVTMVLVGVGYMTGAWSRVLTGLQGWLVDAGWPAL